MGFTSQMHVLSRPIYQTRLLRAIEAGISAYSYESTNSIGLLRGLRCYQAG